MKKYRRTRKACALDNQARLSDMEDDIPRQDAWDKFTRPAYEIQPLSLQARQLVRSQGRQMEHKTVDAYLRDRGVMEIGQENIE